MQRKRFKTNLNIRFAELGFTVVNENYLYIHYEKKIRVVLIRSKNWEIYENEVKIKHESTSLKDTFEEVKRRYCCE